jgi:hypothetical protein
MTPTGSFCANFDEKCLFLGFFAPLFKARRLKNSKKSAFNFKISAIMLCHVKKLLYICTRNSTPGMSARHRLG